MTLSFGTPIDTEHCRIEPLSQGTGTELHRFMIANWEYFKHTIPTLYADSLRKLESWESVVAGSDAQSAQRLFVRLIGRLKATNEIVAAINFAEFRKFPDNSCSIGFLMSQAHAGRGLMRECLDAVLKHTPAQLGVRHVYAFHLVSNLKSARTLASLGFNRVGIVRQYAQIGEDWHDHVFNDLRFDPLGVDSPSRTPL